MSHLPRQSSDALWTGHVLSLLLPQLLTYKRSALGSMETDVEELTLGG